MRLMNPRLCSECNDRDSDSDSVNRIYHYSAIYYHFQATLTEWKSPTRPLIMGGHFVAQCLFYFCVFIAFLSISDEDLTPDSGIKLPDAVQTLSKVWCFLYKRSLDIEAVYRMGSQIRKIPDSVQSGRYPTLTPNEQKYIRAVESGNVVNHYHHTWIDGKGKQHWE